MKVNFKFLVLVFMVCCSFFQAQIKLPKYADSLFSTYYHQRYSLFKVLPQTKDDVVFLGNSITDGAEWDELFQDQHLKNRGISGDITTGVIHRLDEVANRKPSKVFLLIGTNDLARGVKQEEVLKNILLITDYIKQQSPKTQIYVQSILPVNDSFGKFSGHTKNAGIINSLNLQLKNLASKHQYQYIDLHSSFVYGQGKLKADFTNDGLHLKGNAYLLWKHLIFSYVYDLQEKPAVLPLPQQLEWKSGLFVLNNAKTIVVKDQSLKLEASQLQAYLKSIGYEVDVVTKAPKNAPFIELGLGKVKTAQNENEAYQLSVTENLVKITANTPHGIFNGIQTLKQLSRDKTSIDACSITDWPAFSWRGYMIDVGRNYMSMPLLKQQIEVMAAYKMNIFHFHPTEDIAWRIESKLYPELVSPETMLRNKGMYYSETEIKELIQYCKERHITFVPEIDMPGHSAAFERAMKVNMQSEEGLKIVKNILKEFCTTYDVPYIHIGADEVKITNKNFIPEVTAYIESFGKKVIGWQPGGNFTDATIRQLWMEDKSHLSANTKIQFVDSRHLYLNHMDPLEAVTTIFNRKIGDRDQGDASTIGGTICTWPDRAVAKEEDVFTMNPIYPGILAFAERSWLGGGKQGWVANIDEGDKQAFIDFENRMMDEKKLYFKDKIFNYARQSNQVWKLIGPFDNSGDLAKVLDVEKDLLNDKNPQPAKEVTGGTIVLRHWWAPLIKAAIDDPKENTTWYATTDIWSDVDEERDFWIGFYNISRSQASDTPALGTWDNRSSKVWVNGIVINPPKWKRAGQKGNLENPLIDEGYEYRTPTKIVLKKGWNKVLIKAPVGSFKAKEWQNPVKWMFTFVMI